MQIMPTLMATLVNMCCWFRGGRAGGAGAGDVYRQWTHIRTYGTDVFAMDMLSSISQASGDKLMKPMAFYCVFILVLRRLLPDF